MPSEVTEDDVKVTAVLRNGVCARADRAVRVVERTLPLLCSTRYIEFRSELPGSPLGRVHKHLLRARVHAETWDRE